MQKSTQLVPNLQQVQLRSFVSVVPQSCTLFQASVRFNLDPSQSKTDSVLQDAIRQVVGDP